MIVESPSGPIARGFQARRSRASGAAGPSWRKT